ncbi:RcnB family protein [Sphingomonas sp.]|jgi:Ni/Co efflux regulator RcnB|uniref:RcnB family protein n=1 Tax=Sphingomonas sp. TaxID=28214 RepID=UPI002EDB9C50
MRKFILTALAASVLCPVAVSAQSYGEVRRNQRELREDRRDLREAQRRGDRGDVREARRELREDRQEAREDWRDYRRAHADVYRRGGYRGPQGYRYRPIAIGHRFAPSYYGRQYRIDDYRTYRLAAPRYGYQRWVRYGNDVALVDTRSGRVVAVHNRFFY